MTGKRRDNITYEELKQKYVANLEYHKNYQKEYWKKNPEKYQTYKKESIKQYYLANKERLNKATVERRRNKKLEEKLKEEQEAAVPVFV
jgi:hypothetical protein